ncbi:hypothetical protein WJX64_02600 [Leifsonia sp. YIM 134122]|uniref:Tetratrico peptide repeat group 5 domain-containing protein n=1 Tax=Leifsonia stereocauli TaxID=3134136 RepID=A0ABU9W0A0_9MICO
MTQLITWESIEGLERRAPRLVATPDQHRAVAETITSWATDAASFYVDDGITRAHLLLVGAEHLEMAGDLDGARRLAETAAAHPTAEPFGAYPTLISLAFASGDTDQAVALADEVRAASDAGLHIILMIAETFELNGDLARAERWNTIGARRASAGSLSPTEQYLTFLGGRFRARRDAGKPLDGLDDEAQELRAEAGLAPLV